MKNMKTADIRFMVGDKEHALLPPTARIAFNVSRELGGLGKAFERCQQGELDVYFTVLRESCASVPPDDEGLRQFIFENAAVVHLACVKYLWSLERGGRPFPDSVEEAAEAEDESAEGNATPANP